MAYGDGDGQIFVRFTRSLDVVGPRADARRRHPHLQPRVPRRARRAERALRRRVRLAREAVEEEADGGQGRLADRPGHHGAGHHAPRRCARSRTRRPTRTIRCSAPIRSRSILKNKYTRHRRRRRRAHQLGNSQPRVLPGGQPRSAARPGKAGLIWYKTMLALNQHSDFAEMVEISTQMAAAVGTTEEKAVTKAWKAVGF